MRIVCIGYVVLLTMLLFTSDPTRLIGLGEELPRVLRIVLPAAHVISFFVLAVLALIPRWHVPRWQIVLILAIYGGMTEITQGFLPPRAAEWMDWCQDLAGIAARRGVLLGDHQVGRRVPRKQPKAEAFAISLLR